MTGEDDRHARGVTTYAAILGLPEREVEAALAARVGPVFARETLHAAGGASYQHPALSIRDRSIAVITALVAAGVDDDRLLTHLRLAGEAGLDSEALTVLMTLLASYLGYPLASRAMETVTRMSTTDSTVVAD